MTGRTFIGIGYVEDSDVEEHLNILARGEQRCSCDSCRKFHRGYAKAAMRNPKFTSRVVELRLRGINLCEDA